VTTAKRDLRAGEELDGEGGYSVFGKLAPAHHSLAQGALPLGLAHGVRLRRAVGKDETISWDDVEIDETQPVVRLRRRLESEFSTIAG
jgi:predicted homoserine dehydrogenase-like protein